MLIGDRVEKVLNATGVGSAVKAIANYLDKDCGCSERQESWNNLHLNALNQYYALFNKKDKILTNMAVRNEIGKLYEQYTGKRWTKTECASCNNNRIKELLAHPEFQKAMKDLDIELNGTPQEKIQKAIVKRKPRKRKKAKS